MSKKLVKATLLSFKFTFEFKDESQSDKKGFDWFVTKAITVEEALKAFYSEHGSKNKIVIKNIETEQVYREANFY